MGHLALACDLHGLMGVIADFHPDVAHIGAPAAAGLQTLMQHAWSAIPQDGHHRPASAEQ